MGPPCELVEVVGLPLEAVEPPVLGTAGGVSVPVIMNLDAREKYQGNVVTIDILTLGRSGRWSSR